MWVGGSEGLFCVINPDSILHYTEKGNMQSPNGISLEDNLDLAIFSSLGFTELLYTRKDMLTEEKRDKYVSSIYKSAQGIYKLFRVDTNFSKEGTNGEVGTGLGLILCHEFIRKNGGEIWIESEVNKGTRVYFTQPDSS